LNALDILHSAAAALSLLAAAPWRLLLATVIFIAVSESLMLVPRVGFLLKFCVASLLSAQMLVIFRVAAMGEPPKMRILLDAIYLPPSSMLVLFGCALLPFFVGLSYFALTGRADGLRFFFGNVFKHKPPESKHFLVFKLIMLFGGVPFTYVAPAMVLKGDVGGNALEQGLIAALLYWPSLLAMLLVTVVFEAGMMRLPQALPRKIAAAFSIPLLVLFVAYVFAFTYTLSVRAFGL
jgi:hypothetical protein